MDIEFASNERPTIGVELEIHLIDADSRDLVSAANELLEDLGRGHPGGEHPKAKHELFQSTVEVITGVCESPAQARRDLEETIAELRAAAHDRGVRLVSSGTHPFGIARRQDVSPDPRYHALVEAMQWPARRLLICGMHIHVGVKNGERAIVIINELKRHLPLFLALSSSSPFFEGEDSGLASARSKVFESLPTAGLPPEISDWSEFEEFMGTLLESECISSIREVWWDIRPHPEFGTIELRICDAPSTLTDVTRLAALAQALVAWCDEQIDAGTLPEPPREWTVRENRWFAGRYGVDARLIVGGVDGEKPMRRLARDLVDDLIVMLQPTAARLGIEQDLVGLTEIVQRGSSTTRQRDLVAAGGSLHDVVDQLASEFEGDLLPPS